MSARGETQTGVAGYNLSAGELHQNPWNIFAKPEMESTIVRDKDIDISPISAITDDGPYGMGRITALGLPL